MTQSKPGKRSRSGTPGDVITAAWLAERRKDSSRGATAEALVRAGYSQKRVKQLLSDHFDSRVANPIGAAALGTAAAYTATFAAQHAATTAVGALIANPGTGRPFVGVALDGGPSCPGARDNLLIVDRAGGIIEMIEVHTQEDHNAAVNEKYADLPFIGPFRVLPLDIRDLRREAATPLVQTKRSSKRKT